MGLIELSQDAAPFIKHLNECFGRVKNLTPSSFPDLSNGESIFSVSDYAGENKDGYYQALSYAIVDWNNAELWDASRLALRYSKLDFVRDFEYKKLNKDRERKRLLQEFLDATQKLNGLSLTYLIDKNIRYLFSDKSPHTLLENEGLGKWKPHIAEKLLRIVHLQAPVIYYLTNDNHKFLWLTDRDAITEDMESLGKLFYRIFNFYSTHEFKVLAYAQPFSDPSKSINDLLSIPDLIAGSILEYFNQEKSVEADGKDDELTVQEKTNQILKWLADESSNLRKLVCVLDKMPDNSIKVRFLEMKSNQEHD